MTKQVNIRMDEATYEKLKSLLRWYDSKTKVIAVAIDRLYMERKVTPTERVEMECAETEKQFATLTLYLSGSDSVNVVIEMMAQTALGEDPQLSPNRAREIAAGRIWGAYARERIRLQERVADWRNVTSDLVELHDQIIAAEERKTIQAMLVELTGTRTLLQDMNLVVLETPRNIEQMYVSGEENRPKPA